MASSLRQRLLQDIAELQSKPYPNICLHVQDQDITEACLILTVDGYGPLHLTVEFPNTYPLSPPKIQMNSDIVHPNIFGSYICASILNTQEGYTPAYTLKGIAIQLLSFFGSDKIEQTGGGYSVDLGRYRDMHKYNKHTFNCTKCNSGRNQGQNLTAANAVVDSPLLVEDLNRWPVLGEAVVPTGRNIHVVDEDIESISVESMEIPCQIQDAKMPDEILLMICDNLETEDMMAFAEAWDRIGGVITKFDVIRTRELQCFCLKKDYTVSNIKLGVGVSVTQKGRMGFFESEFDLLSKDGFGIHGIRRSVQGVPFQKWLPLPISYGHWRKVQEQDDVSSSLSALAVEAKLGEVSSVQVIYHFMNDVVVKLNQQASSDVTRAPYYPYEESAKSTLTHASEKAMESYFHLFHLLVCLAVAQPSFIKSANTMMTNFVAGKTSKDDCPSLGHLLVAALISDLEMTPEVMRKIVKETIIRNVVWMLDARGANKPELSFMELSAVSEYRLKHTFEASKTSYRLLMFLNLFRRAAVGNPRRPLPVILDEAFERHGAPPRGSAKKLADSIKYIHTVDNFPDFLVCMGIEKPSGAWFTSFLRTCIEESVKKGYSRMPITQGQALFLRQEKEPSVEAPDYLYPQSVKIWKGSFFPGRDSSSQGGGRGQGRGRGGY